MTNLAGLAEGRTRRDEGMSRTEAADVDGLDKEIIDTAISRLNATRSHWSANDLRHMCPGVRQPLIGARIRSWAARKLIHHVSYVPSDLPSTHAHDIKTWSAHEF